MKKRIAILFHENDRNRPVSRYGLTHISKYWEEDGHEVLHLFGPNEYAPADIAIVHVNLSVVPVEYIEFAERFPVVLNADAVDIRKSSISEQLVIRGDGYEGPVILKSNLNFAGRPERNLDVKRLLGSERLARGLSALMAKIRGSSADFCHQLDYRIFDSVHEVPDACLDRADIVVEKFLPEMEGELYSVRNYHFLGTSSFCMRLFSPFPIVGVGTVQYSELIEPSPKILDLRQQMGFDYGKFDYLIRNGETILLDANKTTGAALETNPEREARRRRMADGLYPYLREA